MIDNLKKQLEKIEKEHPESLNKDNYWRGVKVGLQTAINIAEENLILNVSSSQLKEKETPTFEDWLNMFFKRVDEFNYVDKETNKLCDKNDLYVKYLWLKSNL